MQQIIAVACTMPLATAASIRIAGLHMSLLGLRVSEVSYQACALGCLLVSVSLCSSVSTPQLALLMTPGSLLADSLEQQPSSSTCMSQ